MGNSNSNTTQQHVEQARRTGVCSLQGMSLKALPPGVCELPNLRSLEVSDNRLPDIPPQISALSSLKSLTANSNRIGSLPDEIGSLGKLETISLSHNQLLSIPATFGNLTHLKTVNLSSNHLREFPACFLQCRQIQVIDLSLNRINSLPENMSQLQATELNLNRNQIAALPESLAACPKLKVLRAEENCLSMSGVPEKILAESKVSTLALDGNTFMSKELERHPGYDKYQERYTANRRKCD